MISMRKKFELNKLNLVLNNTIILNSNIKVSFFQNHCYVIYYIIDNNTDRIEFLKASFKYFCFGILDVKSNCTVLADR